jgi:hypothetical protein
MLNQIRRASFWGRYWSLLTALALPVLVFFFLDFQNARMIVSIISIVLLAHAWHLQMRSSQSTWRLLLWTSLLLLPMLGAIWLGLNVIRGNTYFYAADYQRHLGDYRQNLYWYVVEGQDWIVWAALVDMGVSLLLALATFFHRKEIKTS